MTTSSYGGATPAYMAAFSEKPKHNPALITMVIVLRSKKNNRNNFYCLRPKHNHHGD